jgi:hypothetical protein
MLLPGRRPMKRNSPDFLPASDIGIDGVPGVLGQLKPDGTAGLSLTHSRSIHGIAVGRNITDFYGNNVAASAACCRSPD